MEIVKDNNGHVNCPKSSGYIRPGTSYEQLEAFQQRYGVGKLRNMFRYPKKEWKVTKIVFVQSCVDTVPDKLIDCLNEVLREVDPWTFRQKCKHYSKKMFAIVFLQNVFDYICWSNSIYTCKKCIPFI